MHAIVRIQPIDIGDCSMAAGQYDCRQGAARGSGRQAVIAMGIAIGQGGAAGSGRQAIIAMGIAISQGGAAGSERQATGNISLRMALVAWL